MERMNEQSSKEKNAEALRKQQRAEAKDEDGNRCPHCNHKTKAGDDICESCNAWLLTEQCCFCYTPFKLGQKFCGSCGNPPAGIICPGCGNHANFDICPKCNTALSKRAKPYLEQLKQSPELQALLLLAAEKKPDSESVSANNKDDIRGQMEQLKAQMDQYLNNKTSTSPVNRNSFSFNNENKDFSDQFKPKIDQSLQSISQEPTDEELQNKVKELQNKLFEDNQSARMFYESIKIVLPKLRKCSSLFGWQCNYSRAVHYNGPSGCVDPSKGGRWICSDDVEQLTPYTFNFEGEYYSPAPETPVLAQTP